MKKTIIIILVSLFLIMGGIIGYLIKDSIKKGEEIDRLRNNENAYILELNNKENEAGVYRMTISELKLSKDSLTKELIDKSKKLKIKEKELKEIIHFKSELRDTVEVYVYGDTIIDRSICNFDTTIVHNSYMKNHISLKDGILRTEPHQFDDYDIFQYITKEWKQPKFWKRVVTFKWGKYEIERFKLVNSNELNKIRQVKVIKIIE